MCPGLLSLCPFVCVWCCFLKWQLHFCALAYPDCFLFLSLPLSHTVCTLFSRMEAAAAPPALSLKDQGNVHFNARNYLKAAALYTQAIKNEPENAALYRYSSTFSATSSQSELNNSTFSAGNDLFKTLASTNEVAIASRPCACPP